MKKEELKKKIDKLWETSKNDLEKIMKNAERLAKDGERYIKDKSEKGKKQLEIAALALQREKLYYELGKVLAKTPKAKWAGTKKALDIVTKIKGINLKIGQKKR
ncbi:MAG: hypothetical protein KAJ66_01205 [Candidatus Omnitrophica bacterium]|nr:hypothetical protein [Candidatus Omnitrophota bacterium]